MKGLIIFCGITILPLSNVFSQSYEWEISTIKDTVLTELYLPKISSSTCLHRIPFYIKKTSSGATEIKIAAKENSRGDAELNKDYHLADTVVIDPTAFELNETDTVYYDLVVVNDENINEDEYLTLEIPYSTNVKPFDNHLIIRIRDYSLNSCSEEPREKSIILSSAKKDDNNVGLLKLKRDNIFAFSPTVTFDNKNKRYAFKGLRNRDVKPNKTDLDTSSASKVELEIIGANAIIEDGSIKFLIVETYDKSTSKSIIFENHLSPISLTNFYGSRTKNNLLKARNYNQDRKIYIETWDVLEYYSVGNELLYPSDSEILLSNDDENSQKFLSTYGDINQSINAEIYSDFLGLESEANGILQTEIRSTFTVNSESIKKSWWFFSNSITPYLKFSKFDSSTDSLRIAMADSSLDRLSIIRLNDVNFGLEWAIFKRKKIHEIELDFGLEWARTKNVMISALTTKDVNQTIVSLGTSFSTRKGKNFGFYMGYKTFFHKLWKNSGLNERKPILIHNFNITLDYFPTDNSTNKLFFRLKPVLSNHRLAQENFVQVQFGTKIAFSKLINKEAN
ncbi:MAG: hypothetical protein ABJR05_10330 [Balneola sp.]